MKKLYFVRHGQSQANVDETFAGQSDTPLTSLGREQAKTAGKAARELHIDRIVSSPLSRAFDTAVIIAQTIGYPVSNIDINDLFKERNYGSLQGKAWGSQGEEDINGIAGVEPIESLLQRGRQAYQYLHDLPDDTVLVVAHGTFWRALRAAMHPDIPFIAGTEPRNAVVEELA
ncbi:MAG TPA: histidine phosphatase family protein [Candidatus Saccharimonadales bacterium]|nr:histidine phosphatase family protein [Candidatus Saccharimonadales bacterium]